MPELDFFVLPYVPVVCSEGNQFHDETEAYPEYREVGGCDGSTTRVVFIQFHVFEIRHFKVGDLSPRFESLLVYYNYINECIKKNKTDFFNRTKFRDVFKHSQTSAKKNIFT